MGCRDRGRAAGCTLWRDRPQRVGRSARGWFATSHRSNFLNPRRGISPEAVDRPLDVLRVNILDLADPEELRLQALERPSARRRTMRHSLCSGHLGTRDLAAAQCGMADGAARDRHGQKLRNVHHRAGMSRGFAV